MALTDKNKPTIDRLKDLKSLYEAGILTQEEMEAEKAEILGISTTPAESVKTNKTTVACPVCGEQIEDGLDVCPICHEQIKNPTPSVSPIQQSPTPKPDKSNKGIIWGGIALVAIIVVALGVYFVCGNSDTIANEQPEEDAITEATLLDEQSDKAVAEVEYVESDKDDIDDYEVGDALDHWSGVIQMTGSLSLHIRTQLFMNLQRDGSNIFSGEIQILCGESDGDSNNETVKPTSGMLRGRVKCLAKHDVMVVILESSSTKAGEDGNSLTSIKNGDKLFEIRYDGYNYNVNIIGEMGSYFTTDFSFYKD